MDVLVVHSRLQVRDVEHEEVRQTVAGLLEAGGTALRVQATDGRRVYGVRVLGGQLDLVDDGPSWRSLVRHYDVAHVHMVLPWWQLLAALVLRARGVRVVLTPMSMLGRDFAQTSWFRSPAAWRRRSKPWAVGLLGRAWRHTASHLVVASAHEAAQAGLAAGTWSLLPLPTPATPLAETRLASAAAPAADAPLALVSRMDPYRKGFDRLASWLAACADQLPRPAAVLYTADGGEVPEALRARVDDGTLVWDRATHGAALAEPLSRSRAVVLLSRWEGQPRVLREAAVQGVPTLSTPAANFTEAVQVLGTGRTVIDPDDPAQVQAAFVAVLQDHRDPRAARRLFDRVEVGITLLELLRRVAAGDRRPVDHYERIANVLRAG